MKENSILTIVLALLLAIVPLTSLNVMKPPAVKAEFVPDANTLALWHFNEGSGQVVHDASTHSNNGTLGPSMNVEDRDPSWTAGMSGLPGDYAVSFDDWHDYVRILDNPDGSLDLPGNQWTIELYAYIRQMSRSNRGSGDNWNWFIGKQVYSYEETGYMIHQCTYHPAFSCYFLTNPGYVYVGETCTVPLNQWTYFKITYNGQYLKIYFDDVLIAMKDAGSFAVAGNANALTLGKSLIDDAPWHDSVDCIMDEVRISNVVRGAEGHYYWKPFHADYAPSGIPDFDQRQWGTYNWTSAGAWSHCGPVAVANSLWWLDSEYERTPNPPPAVNDSFSLVKSYGQGMWDDHDPLNVPPLVEHLAFLMDTDGRRTGLAHSGTNVNDMEAGLTHYLSWTGVNPKGDVNGDGIVNKTDADLATAAFGSAPGSPRWNMAADVYPATITYPPTTDNKVDLKDISLIADNFNTTGLFYEHTVNQPDFSYVVAEVEKCQDVVLLIGYWTWTGSSWYREPGGHYVTVAGVDSTNMMIAISDPVQDAFETGMIPQGRIPVPHLHPPPEPPYIAHNDAAFVSQDIYSAVPILPPLPCPGGTWAFNDFASWRPIPPCFAVVEAAVVTSEVPHDVAVTNVTTIKTGCIPCETVCKGMNMEVYVTVANQGFWNVTFDVTVYANSTAFGVQTVAVDANQGATLTFVWDTNSTVEYDTYTIGAIASWAIGEIDLPDNSFTDGTVTVTHMGDITGDGKVEIADLSRVSAAYGSLRVNDPSESKYGQYWHPPREPPCPTCPHAPNTDVTGDRRVEIEDLSRTSGNFGWHE